MAVCFNCGKVAERIPNRIYCAHCRKCGFIFAADRTAHDELMANRPAESTVVRSMQSRAGQTDVERTHQGYAPVEA